MRGRSLLVALMLSCVGLQSLGVSSSYANTVAAVGTPPPVDFGSGSGVQGNQGDGTVEGSGSEHGGGGPGGVGIPTGPGCTTCTYTWVAVCNPAVTPNCGAVAAQCPLGFTLETELIHQPPKIDALVGVTECRSPTGLTPAQVQQAAVDRFSQLLTTALPTHQPGNGAIVNLPALFATNTPAEQVFTETLLGIPVTLDVHASWTWDFGDGTTLTTTEPGGPYPVTTLSHTYLRSGHATVALTTNWTGTFSMAGGPAAVIPGGPIPRVSAPFVLDIHEAHGVLVTN